MTQMYVRVRKDGFLMPWCEILASNPDCEVITEQEAFPERSITPEIAKRVAKPKRRRKTKALDLTTDIPEEPTYTDPDLAAEVARGWPE